MKKTTALVAAALVLGGLTLAAPKSADAGVKIAFGNVGYGFNRGFGNRGFDYGFNRGYSNFGRGVGYGGYYDRGFGYGRGCDYRRPVVLPHRDRFHTQPYPGVYGRGFLGR